MIKKLYKNIICLFHMFQNFNEYNHYKKLSKIHI